MASAKVLRAGAKFEGLPGANGGLTQFNRGGNVEDHDAGAGSPVTPVPFAAPAAS